MRRAPPERRAARGPARSQTSSTRPFDNPAQRFLKKRRANTARPVASTHESFGRTEYCPKQSQELTTIANQKLPLSRAIEGVFKNCISGTGQRKWPVVSCNPV